MTRPTHRPRRRAPHGSRRLLVLPVLIILAALAAPPAGAADLVTVPLTLPSAALDLFADQVVELAFDAGQPLLDVTEMRLHVTGTYHVMRSVCWVEGDFGDTAGAVYEDPGMVAGLVAAAVDVDRQTAWFVPEDPTDPSLIAFDVEIVFEAADWSALAGGAGTVTLTGLPCEQTGTYPLVCACGPSATLTAAALRVGLAGGVAAEASNWGSLKAQYR